MKDFCLTMSVILVGVAFLSWWVGCDIVVFASVVCATGCGVYGSSK